MGGITRFLFGGTSAATPCVAGIAALVLSKNSELTWQQAKTALQNGCEQVGDETYTGGQALHYGYGRANAFRSVSTYTAADTTSPWVTLAVTRTGRQIEVTFSEKMGAGVTTPANYTLSGIGKGTLAANPSSVRWTHDNTYLLEWTSGIMVSGEALTVMASPTVKDVAGNAIGSPNFGNATGSRVIHSISCGPVLLNGSSPLYPFESEKNYFSGVGQNLSLTINSIVNNDGTPLAVYKTERNILNSASYPGDIVYTLPNITAGVSHTVRLYFANNGNSTNPGDILFDIYINDVLKAANFDLISQAGGSFIGIWREYANITPNGSGQIVVKILPKNAFNQTWQAWYYNATLGGIKVTAN